MCTRSRRSAVLVAAALALILAALAPGAARGDRAPPGAAGTLSPRRYLPLVADSFSPYLHQQLAQATYASIQAMVEPRTGLPHDRFDATLFDIAPQFALVRTSPYTSTAAGASLTVQRCASAVCRASGAYGLKLGYVMPSGTYGSYNIDSPGFDVGQATYLEGWAKGAQGGERFEIVLWSNCGGGFPGRPASALITAGPSWQRWRIPLADVRPYADLSRLCRLSFGFNDAIHPGGTLYLDQIAFVDSGGTRIHVPLDEETNVTNIGLYIADVLGALDLGWERYADVVDRLSTTLASIESFQKWHGFPQTHNRVVSLQPSSGDRCISTVDLGNLAAGLIVLRQRIPELAPRASALLSAMEWDWLYDSAVGLPYGCRYPDGAASSWHYDWLAADSRLAHAIGIGSGKLPAASWQRLNRAHEAPRCIAADRWHFKPGWGGGGLFMAFLPAIFLDESRGDLAISARNFVADQICQGGRLALPAWGWSATALPPDGATYCGYGCIRDDILVPHASILAAGVVTPDELARNLQSLEALGARAPASDGAQSLDFGFRASVDWRTREVAGVYLVLDQSLALLSLVNVRTNGGIRRQFCRDAIAKAAKNLIPDYAASCA